MLFNSFEFLVFLPIVFCVYWLVLKTLTQRNVWLLAASYFFYGWWDFRFLALIIGVTALNWWSGMLIERFEGRPTARKCVLWAMVAVCIGTLWLFKYFNFFSSEFCRILNFVGFEADAVTLDIVLPVGISFYTFQALGYTIDVYRGDMKAMRDPLPFFVFISFFPQLVAGPIERASNLLPQFLKNRTFNYQMGSDGMKLILWGLFKKIVVADNAAEGVNEIFANYQDVGTINLWMGAILFSFQIYGDFSGYSDIAIGTARLFGIRLMRNFKLPYFSRDIAEFWRRWHVSLSQWFRDYIYIPLGGSRRGKAKKIRNTVIVFLVSGMWHGANITYLLWGAYHALLVVPLSLIGRSRRHMDDWTEAKTAWEWSKTILSMGVTFILVFVGRVIYRAETVDVMWRYLTMMFCDWQPADYIIEKKALVWGVLLLAMEWVGRRDETPITHLHRGVFRYPVARWAFYVMLYLVCIVFGGVQSNFIYFKF